MSNVRKIRVKSKQGSDINQVNIDLVNAIKKIENFARKYHVLASDSTQDYNNGQQTKKRIIQTTLMRVVMVVFITKYIFSFFSKNRLILALINDETNVIGNSRLFPFTAVFGPGTVLLMEVYIQYLEMRKKFIIYEFLGMLKTDSMQLRLNRVNRRKFGRRMNQVIKLFINVYFNFGAIIERTAFIFILCLDYYHNMEDFSLVFLSIWILLCMIACVNFKSVELLLEQFGL